MSLADIVTEANGLARIIDSIEVYKLCSRLSSLETAETLYLLDDRLFIAEAFANFLEVVFCLSKVYIFLCKEGLKSILAESVVTVGLEVSQHAR